MKTNIYLLIAFFVLTSFYSSTEEKNEIENKTILIELFTSQGCSSCPAADKVLKEIKGSYSNVIPLSFHVDYWDRLGWKDTFSKAQFSDRQRNYAQQFKNRTIYTPQMIINGVDEFVGSDRVKAFTLIKKQKESNQIEIEGNFNSDDLIKIAYDLPDINYKAYNLNIALIKNEESVTIKRGENWGKKITYHNIVFDFTELKYFDNKGNSSFKKTQKF